MRLINDIKPLYMKGVMSVKKVTISDIAKEANVSISTISRYINKSGYVAEDKAKRINTAMENLGYISVAQKRKSNIIGLICQLAHDDYFYYDIYDTLRSFSKMGQQVGKAILPIMKTSINDSSLKEAVDFAMKFDIEGLVVAGFMDEQISQENEKMLLELPVPVVMFERNGRSSVLSTVTFDTKAAMKEAVRQLVALGHRRIAYIGCACNFEVEQERYEGYLDGLKEAGIPVDKKLICMKYEYGGENGRSAMQSLLRKASDISAVVASAGSYATGALQAASENEIAVPDQLSIIGMGGTIARVCTPKISSFQFPMDEAAEYAIDTIIKQNSVGSKISGATISFKLKLKQMESVKSFKGIE